MAAVLGVGARPLDLPPVWLTAPPAEPLAAGETWRYEVAVADPEGADVSWSLAQPGPPGFAIEDRGGGAATRTWPVGAGPQAVTLRATVGDDAIEQQLPSPPSPR